MIDKIDFRVEPEVPFTSDFEFRYRKIRSRARATDYYKEVVDLRQYGLPAILHLHCRFNANHKVELVETARMSTGEMVRVVERIFACQARDLSLSRLDLAVDVPRIPVEWFRTRMRVRHKRSFREISPRTNELLPNGGTTLYFGRDPDIFRAYDKVAQLQHQSSWLARRWQPSQFASYEKYGELPNEGSVLTRVERQMRGRIPKELATLNDLRRNASSFNPFKLVVLFPGGRVQPSANQYSVSGYLQGKGLRQSILEIGLAGTWDMLNANSGGNANRTFDRLADFLPPDPADFQIPNLFAMYRQSIDRQL